MFQPDQVNALEKESTFWLQWNAFVKNFKTLVAGDTPLQVDLIAQYKQVCQSIFQWNFCKEISTCFFFASFFLPKSSVLLLNIRII